MNWRLIGVFLPSVPAAILAQLKPRVHFNSVASFRPCRQEKGTEQKRSLVSPLPKKQQRCSVTLLFVFSLNSFKENLWGLLLSYPGTEALWGHTSPPCPRESRTCFFCNLRSIFNGIPHKPGWVAPLTDSPWLHLWKIWSSAPRRPRRVFWTEHNQCVCPLFYLWVFLCVLRPGQQRGQRETQVQHTEEAPRGVCVF